MKIVVAALIGFSLPSPQRREQLLLRADFVHGEGGVVIVTPGMMSRPQAGWQSTCRSRNDDDDGCRHQSVLL